MKRTQNSVMNELVVVGSGIALIATRLIVGEKTFSEIPLLRGILQWVLIVSAVHIIGCFIMGLFAGKENKEWWEQSGEQGKKNSGGNLTELYLKGLIVSLPLFVYGILAYAAFFLPWKALAYAAFSYVIIGLVRYIQRRRTNRGSANKQLASGTFH